MSKARPSLGANVAAAAKRVLGRIGAAGARAGMPARATMPGGGASGAGGYAYDAANVFSQELGEWQPALRSPDTEINADRDRMVARARDLVRNDGWAAGGVTRTLDNAIGSQFRLVAKADYRALSSHSKAFDPVWADEFGRAVEAEWRQWADDPARHCDAQRKRGWTGLMYLALRHQLVDGDALATLLWDPDAVGFGAARYATRVQLIDPDRLSNPYQQMDTHALRGGVEIDGNGAAVAYHIRRAHQGDWFDAAEAMIWDRFPRETAWGRPVVVHHFEGERTAANRGLGIMTPVINRLKMLARYDQAELQQALLQTIFGSFIESPYDAQDVQNALDAEDGDGPLSAYQQMREQFHSANALSLGGVRIPILAPGERINTVAATRPNSGFDAFQRAVLRNIAAATGQSAEQLSWDYSQTNYSSARAAMLEAWKTLSRRRDNFAAGFADPIYGAWLEEAFDVADLPLPRGAPGFLEMRAAYARCRWIGPARGWVDPVAERQGAVLGLDAGFNTLEAEAADQGQDYEEVLDQRAVEIRMMKERGIPLPEWAAGTPAVQAGKPPEKPDAA